MNLNQRISISSNSSDVTNSTSAQRTSPHSPTAAAFIILVVIVIILVTIIGNVLVVVAVFTSRALRAPQNLFLVSLASADILVATLVIPFSLANEVMGYWYFGTTWCAFYLALDVLFCTSSIVHLCAISLDRYWSVTTAVTFRRTPKRIKSTIAVVWIISAVISFPPFVITEHNKHECSLNNDTWYILFSCLVSFFVPAVIMIVVYCKIYRVAKQRSSAVFVAKNGLEVQPSLSKMCFVRKDTSETESQRSQNLGSNQRQEELDDTDPEESSAANSRFSKSRIMEGSNLRRNQVYRLSWVSAQPPSQSLNMRQQPISKTKVAQKREKRFTFVLAVVIGVFVLCWFPFFFTYSLHAICRESCSIPHVLFNIFFWIGYCNSAVNPIIYTFFNRDFRKAFKIILFKTAKTT